MRLPSCFLAAVLCSAVFAASVPSGLSLALKAGTGKSNHWPFRQEGSPLDTALRRKRLRIGHQGPRDEALGARLAQQIGQHYNVSNLQVVWVADSTDLTAGLKAGRYEAALNDRGELFTLPGGYHESELSEVLSAAFHEFTAKPDRYGDLHQKYLGVRREPPHDGNMGTFLRSATPGSTFDRVLRAKRLRFGFARQAPYYYSDNGQDVGFEKELGDALGEILARRYSGLQWEWVEQSFRSGGSVVENLLLYDALEPGLLSGRYDAMFSGVIRRPDRPVAAAASTMLLYWNVLYTGKGNLDVSRLRNTDRAQFVQFLRKNPYCTLLSPPGGAAQETVTLLAAETGVRALQGQMPKLLSAAAEQTEYFIVADSTTLANVARAPGFKGVNLNLSLHQPTELIAPLTALDP